MFPLCTFSACFPFHVATSMFNNKPLSLLLNTPRYLTFNFLLDISFFYVFWRSLHSSSGAPSLFYLIFPRWVFFSLGTLTLIHEWVFVHNLQWLAEWWTLLTWLLFSYTRNSIGGRGGGGGGERSKRGVDKFLRRRWLRRRRKPDNEKEKEELLGRKGYSYLVIVLHLDCQKPPKSKWHWHGPITINNIMEGRIDWGRRGSERG